MNDERMDPALAQSTAGLAHDPPAEVGRGRTWILPRGLDALLNGSRPHAPTLRAALMAIGIDPDRPTEGPVSSETYHRAVLAIARELSPEDPSGMGLHLAGRCFLEGWTRNPCGRVFIEGLRGLPLERALVRLCEGVRLGAEGLELSAQVLGTSRVRLLLTGLPMGSPTFFEGYVAALLLALGWREARVQPEPGLGPVVLLVSWPPPTS